MRYLPLALLFLLAACKNPCVDGEDNDGDGISDCEDFDCAGDLACISGFCGDQILDEGELCDPPDNISCDAQCQPIPEVGRCGDAADNDGDALIDCADPDCAQDNACLLCGDGSVTGAEQCDPPDDISCDASCRQIPEADRCGDTFDNDNDGLSDCDDSDCLSDPLCAAPSCGDGVVNGTEQCDPPDNVTCDTNCQSIAAANELCQNTPSDLKDDDLDGAPDCADSECAALAECAPGAGVIGDACVAHADCSSLGDPQVCIEFLAPAFSFSGGYCSSLCTLATPNCGNAAECVDANIGNGFGVCLDECVTNGQNPPPTGDCRSGYSCRNFLGSVSRVCAPL